METSAKTLTTDQTAVNRWRGMSHAEPWPDELLERFCLRMSSQGMCVSRALMLCDRRYALEQLSHGHNMADDTLRAMAVELFRHFLNQRSGIVGVH
ncbi:hypothetical protein [Hydrogenophaga sp.]|uniref:hypothetical protein n=1 Tax=Hydrogenophaga sp. TaxID=1904254 RepID=UPI003F70FC63